MNKAIHRTLRSGHTLYRFAAAGVIVVCLFVAGALNARSIPMQSVLSQQRPSFEVASVKAFDPSKMNCSNCDHFGHQLDAQRFVDRTSLLTYMVAAYGFQHLCMLKVGTGEDCPEISGNLPSWVKTDRWEILAKLPPNIELPANLSSYAAREGMPPQIRLMLQVLLEDRFHLAVHRERKDLPVFVLSIGKNGPNLMPSNANSGVIKLPDGTLSEHHGFMRTDRVPTQDGTLRLRYSFQSASMQEAADQFSMSFDRPVLDRTGLKGDYDFTLEIEWPPDGGRGLPGRFPSAAALSTALQAVGLQLESTRDPIEVLIVDRIEKPSEN